MNTDGSDRKTIVTNCHLPDGIVVDVDAGHIYWTNMGIPSLDDGSIERADLDGKNRKTIVAQGDTYTPKQIILDKKGGKLYWCATARECASCAAIWMARGWRRSLRPGTAKPIGGMRRDGA